MKEEWKAVPNTDKFYSVSNIGRIKSHIKRIRNDWGQIAGFEHTETGKIISGSIYNGYLGIDTNRLNNRKIFYVHRMVAGLFVPNSNNYKFINHLDGDKLNNHMNNLEWCTHKQNMDHAIHTGLINNRGEGNGHAVLNKESVLEIRAAYNLGCFDYRDFAKVYGTTVDNIRHIIKRRSWKHI